jgi:hypothetical protein
MKAKGKAKARKAPIKDLPPKRASEVKGGETLTTNIEAQVGSAISTIGPWATQDLRVKGDKYTTFDWTRRPAAQSVPEAEVRAALGIEQRGAVDVNCYTIPPTSKWLGDRYCRAKHTVGDVRVAVTVSFRADRLVRIMLTFKAEHFDRMQQFLSKSPELLSLVHQPIWRLSVQRLGMLEPERAGG